MEQEGTVKVQFTPEGHEIPDPTPVEMPIGFKHPPTIRELIRKLIQTEISEVAQREGEETFEESDDFDTGEDEDMRSPYELDDEIEHRPLTEFVEERPMERPSSQPSGDKVPPKDKKPEAPPAADEPQEE